MSLSSFFTSKKVMGLQFVAAAACTLLSLWGGGSWGISSIVGTFSLSVLGVGLVSGLAFCAYYALSSIFSFFKNLFGFNKPQQSERQNNHVENDIENNVNKKANQDEENKHEQRLNQNNVSSNEDRKRQLLTNMRPKRRTHRKSKKRQSSHSRTSRHYDRKMRHLQDEISRLKKSKQRMNKLYQGSMEDQKQKDKQYQTQFSENIALVTEVDKLKREIRALKKAQAHMLKPAETQNDPKRVASKGSKQKRKK